MEKIQGHHHHPCLRADRGWVTGDQGMGIGDWLIGKLGNGGLGINETIDCRPKTVDFLEPATCNWFFPASARAFQKFFYFVCFVVPPLRVSAQVYSLRSSYPFRCSDGIASRRFYPALPPSRAHYKQSSVYSLLRSSPRRCAMFCFRIFRNTSRIHGRDRIRFGSVRDGGPCNRAARAIARRTATRLQAPRSHGISPRCLHPGPITTSLQSTVYSLRSSLSPVS